MKEFLDKHPYEEGPPSGATPHQQQVPEAASPANDDHPTWTFRDTMTGAVLTLVPWLGLAALPLITSSSQSTARRTTSSSDTILSGIITFILLAVLESTFLIAPLWFSVVKPRRLARERGLSDPGIRPGLAALGFRAFQLWQAAAALALGIVAIFAASALYSAITDALHISAQTNVDVLLKNAAAHPWTTVATLIVAVTVAPFCEEVFFRGYFFQGLRLRTSLPVAVVLSAVVFGLAHGDPGSLVLLIVIGLLLAILRWKTRSIWPGMILHMLNNFLGALVIIQAIHFH